MVRRRSWPGVASSWPSYADFFAVAVDDDVARAIDAAQHRVVGLLDARLADHVAGLVEVVTWPLFEVLLRDLADVTDQVRREAVARIKAALLVHASPARATRCGAPR